MANAADSGRYPFGENDQPSSEAPVASCWDCKQALKPPGARSCVTCKAAQDWRRYIVVSQATLALVIALLSVLSVVVPMFVRALAKEKAQIVVEALRVRPSGLQQGETLLIEAAVANGGQQTGLIRSFLIQFDHDVHCGADTQTRVCGSKVLPEGTCELIYFVKGQPVETATSRLVEAKHIEVAELHYLLSDLKIADASAHWVGLYADIRQSDGTKECLSVDIAPVKGAGPPDRAAVGHVDLDGNQR